MNHGLEPQRYSLYAAERLVVRELVDRIPSTTRAIVEIGAFTGQTTTRVFLPLLAVRMGTVALHVIDPWDGAQDASDDEAYQAFLAAVGDAPVVIHRARSHDVTPPEGLGFVLEDGDHRQPDLQRWYDALVPGGILVCQDRKSVV